MIYRRFGYCFARLLLTRQDEISRIEQQLSAMDRRDEKEGNDIYIKSPSQDAKRKQYPTQWACSRTELLENLELKLGKYGFVDQYPTCSCPLIDVAADLLTKAQQLKALDRPSHRDYRSVLHFMENDGGPVYEHESGFIYEKEDLVTIRPGRDHAWLDNLLEWLLHLCKCRLTMVS